MTKGSSFIDRWVSFSVRRPFLIFAIATTVLIVSGLTALNLTLKSDFIELLPTDSPSVVNLERLKQRVSSYATLTVAIKSPDLETSQRFAEDLVVKLEELQPDMIQFIDYNIRDLTQFYKDNQWLFADLEDLVDLRDRLKKRIKEETQAALFESLDDTPVEKTDLRIDEFRKKYEEKAKVQDRYPGGYYTTPDRDIIAIFVRPPATKSELNHGDELVAAVQKKVDELVPSNYHPELTVGFTGDVKTQLEERDALATDIGFISIIALLAIFGLLILHYRSLRAIMLTGMPVILGAIIALAFAYLTIGHFNAATAFLSAIIVGNGVNFMIMLMARFLEEIRVGGPDSLEQSLKTSVRGTIRGTAVASLAAVITYGALIFAGFRGFREFGIIGGVGMLMCWIVTFATGPALITLAHRLKPMAGKGKGVGVISGKIGGFVANHPGKILLVSSALTFAGLLAFIPYAKDPFQYDFRKLRNKVGIERGSAKLSKEIDKIFELPQSPTPVVANELADVLDIKQRILSAEGADNIVGDVKTVFDVLPKEQEAKLAVLGELRELVDSKLDFLTPSEREKVLEYRPPERLRVLTIEDVPEIVARPFTESDGTRGRILYVYAKPGNSLLDGRYLLKFAKFLRGIPGEGDTFLTSGQPLVFADMIDAIINDGTQVTVIAVIGIFLLLIVAFRSGLYTGSVLLAAVLGTLWMICIGAVFDIKLNFLNFVVIPIMLGDGVDYGANIIERYRAIGKGGVAEAIQTTGAAVMLESLTTMLGFASLIMSSNMALQSFGILANVGEITCLAASTIVMMALIAWIERRRARKAAIKQG